MVSRYSKRKLITNNSEIYSENFSVRDLKFISQYDTPELPRNILSKTKDLIYSYHVFSHGDRLYKLASEHYGDPKLWWILALVNSKPTDAHFSVGDLVLIPTPVNKVLEIYGI